MDIVLITCGSRYKLFEQTLTSMRENSHDWSSHTLTIVLDALSGFIPVVKSPDVRANRIIHNWDIQGASASRNIGAGSIPKYRRQNCVMFSDDDTYYCPGWDALLERTIETIPANTAISGHAHPFNQSEHRIWGKTEIEVPLLLSTVHMVMPWEVWDRVGYFVEPGGPGGSEDYDWCVRAHRIGVGLAVTFPMCVIHTGLISSAGKQIVGYNEMVRRNEEIIAHYGLQGKVHIE